MKKVLVSLGLACGLTVASQPVLAADIDKVLKARQALMQVQSWNIGILAAMAKGDMPYDAEIAQAAADNLLAAVSMKNPTMWPKGSDNGTLGDKTRAKPDIWTTYPKISEKGKDMQEAAAKMAAVAGNGLDAVKANMGQLGDGCKGCHKPFRAPKD